MQPLWNFADVTIAAGPLQVNHPQEFNLISQPTSYFSGLETANYPSTTSSPPKEAHVDLSWPGLAPTPVICATHFRTHQMHVDLRSTTITVPQTEAGAYDLLHLLHSRKARCMVQREAALQRLHEQTLYLNVLRCAVDEAGTNITETEQAICRARLLIRESGLPVFAPSGDCMSCRGTHDSESETESD
uniref:Uncharacterized protein n=1 Tax=Mycena chlorophos TaxID=658473 RepID=A0ABQ0LVL5_MYCCL|nr:predicted protein [Mycena chlorophos]